MKALAVVLLTVGLSSSAFARVHCVEQAQAIAEAAYENSLKPAAAASEGAEMGALAWEFDFATGGNHGTKILVKMAAQADAGTHCEIESLTSRNY